MAQRYEPTADIEVLLEALKKHADNKAYASLATEVHELENRIHAQEIAKRDWDYQSGQVDQTKENVAKAKQKVAQIINTLSRLGCPDEVIKSQWQTYDKKFVLPWPNGHDLAKWITKAE
jgi:hypothetical protein